MIDDQLKQAIRDSGESFYAIAKNSGTSQPVVSRFVRGKRSMTIDTASRVCDYLGLRLTTRLLPKSRRKKK